MDWGVGPLRLFYHDHKKGGLSLCGASSLKLFKRVRGSPRQAPSRRFLCAIETCQMHYVPNNLFL